LLLDEAIQAIESDQERRLVSVTKRVTDVNPLAFFAGGKRLRKTRCFWTNNSQDFFMVGIGCAHAITAEKRRFEQTHKQWKNVLAQAWVHNPYDVPGTGLAALGGMAFDPEKPATRLWKHFKTSQFIIPEFVLIKYEEKCYMTIHAYVGRHDSAQKLADYLSKTVRRLLAHAQIPERDVAVVKKRENAPEKWKETVRKATEIMKKGTIKKIVLARELRLQLSDETEIARILQKLLKTQPNSYVFAFVHGNDCFLGATPERLVKVEKQSLLSTCLAGTAPRGRTKEEDAAIKRELLNDPKNREEHDFVVRMIRQAIEETCHDITIPDTPVVYPFKNLQHLYTPVTATLNANQSVLDVVERLHPTPALGGVPRAEALAFIREHEVLDRGWYGAPIGWMDDKQNAELAVAIRSGLIHGDEAWLFAGCWVVADSDPEAEYDETRIKFLPMLSVLEG